jgi:flagella basal body P-ring formation protein FlgA
LIPNKSKYRQGGYTRIAIFDEVMVQARRIPNGEKLNPEYKKAKAVDEEQVYSYRKK